MDIFLRGLIIGFSIAAPVGPIGVLCIRRTLAEGRLTGFLSGLGAASADMLYGAVAAFGLTAVQDLLLGGADWLRLAGGIFLLYLGVRTFVSKPSELRGHRIQRRPVRSLYFHFFPDHHQPVDDPVVHRHLCRAAPGRDYWQLHFSLLDGPGRVPGLGYLVADA